MGRTNPTFRDALSSVRGDWDRYRRGLRREHKDAFDALFADAEAHADASGHLNAREPMHPVFLSMLLEQKLTIRDLEARVADLEASLDDEATPDDEANPDDEATLDAEATPGADASAADTAADAAADDARPDPEAD